MLTLNLDRDDWNDERVLGDIRNAASGEIVVPDTLELPWKDNTKGESCIPLGSYLCVLKYSPEHGCNLYWITGVEDREDVEIHWGNYPSNSLGCVLVGQAREANAIDHSRDAYNNMMSYLAGIAQFTLVVRDVRAGSTSGGAQ